MPDQAGLVRFLRGLLAGAVARRVGEHYVLPDGRRAAAASIEELHVTGAIDASSLECRSSEGTSSWLKRRLLDGDRFADQHRLVRRDIAGPPVNLAESPLARLAHGLAGEPAFLERHHVEAGERVRRLTERAHLAPRLTMTYSASQTAGGRINPAGDISDLAADARRALADIHRILPRDCAGVVLDVCGLLKGLQDVERDRGWPRRSAKLVLRIGLDRLAEHYGISAVAVGKRSGEARVWMEEGARPERFE
jgi:hypothetical protein